MNNKLMNNLSYSDLKQYPIWKCFYNNNSDLEVQPSNEIEIYSNYDDDSEKCDLVLTEYMTKSGAVFHGFCWPDEQCGMEIIQPVLFTERGQVQFFKHEKWTEDEKNDALDNFKLKYSDVFPITFTTKIKFDGEYYKGIIKNFEYCDKFENI